METPVVTSQYVRSSMGLAARGRRRLCRTTLLAAMALAVAGAAGTAVANTVYTYTPVANTSPGDLWSSGTDWSAIPAGGSATELTFSSNSTTFASGYSNTNTDDISGLFSLNILDLNGGGTVSGATAAATINIANTAPSTGLDFVANGATNPTVNLNALAGSKGLTYAISAPVILTNDTTFTGTGNASFQFNGTLSGSGNITKSGSSTLILGADSSGDTGSYYTGSIDVVGGTLAIGNERAVTNGGNLYTTGTLTVGSGATFETLSNPAPAYGISVSGVYGSGTVNTGNREVIVNYNGSTADSFTGNWSGGNPVKDGVGTLDFTGLSNNGLGHMAVGGGGVNLNGMKSSGSDMLTLAWGTVNYSPTTASDFLFGANSGLASLNSPGTVITVTPSSSLSGSVNVASNSTGSDQWRIDGGVVAMNPGANTNLTWTVGSTAFNTTTAPLNLNGQQYATGVILAPQNGTASLGGTANGDVRLLVVEALSGATGQQIYNDATYLVNGKVDSGVLVQDNNADKSGAFLTYVGNKTSADTVGFEAYNYSTDPNALTNNFVSANNTTNELVSTAQSLTASATVYSLRDDGQAITVASGQTLTVGNGTAGDRAGLILNQGASISGGTLDFAEAGQPAMIYVSETGSTIASKITITGTVGGITVMGPGVLTLTGTNSYSGVTTIAGSTLDVGSLTGSGLSANSYVEFANGVLQASGTFTHSLGTGSGHVFFNNGGGFAARGGTLNVLLNNSSTPLVWGTTTAFLPDFGGPLLFGSATADSTVNFENNLDLGAVTPNYTRIVNVYNNPNSTTDIAVMSGVISSTSAVNILAKDGAGILQLTNANTYAGGTVVNAGTLEVDNTTGSGTGTGYVDLNPGATLAGGGSIAGMVTAGAGSFIHPGDLYATAVANLTVGSLTVDPATFEFSLDSSGGSSQVLDTGAFTQTGTGLNTVDIAALGTSLLDQNYTLMAVADGGLSLSDFAFGNGLTTESLVVGSNTYDLALGITGANSNDLILTVSQSSIPEPAALGLLAISGVALLLGKRRRQSA